jgi:hypothetical protein
MKMGAEESAALFPEDRNLGAREVDGAIARHQQLNRLYLPVVGRQQPALMDKFVGKVLDGVPQNLQRMSSLGANAAFVVKSSHFTI